MWMIFRGILTDRNYLNNGICATGAIGLPSGSLVQKGPDIRVVGDPPAIVEIREHRDPVVKDIIDPELFGRPDLVFGIVADDQRVLCRQTMPPDDIREYRLFRQAGRRGIDDMDLPEVPFDAEAADLAPLKPVEA